MPIVRRAAPDDLPKCLDIVRALPDYFTPDVPEKVREEFARHSTWVLADGTAEVLGFALVDRRSPQAAEIRWAAVHPRHRRRGHGRLMVGHVLDALTVDGVRLVQVKTLDRSAGYLPYEATRAFWEHLGFVQIDTIDPLPDWEPGNPAAIYVAAMQPTRPPG